MRGVVQNISCNSANFLHVHCDAGSEVGNRNLPVGVAGKFAVFRSNNRAAAVFQKDRNAGDGLRGPFFVNLNDERLFWSIAESHSLGITGVDRDSLRFRIEDISLRRFCFRHHIGSGQESGDGEASVFIRPIDSVGRGISSVLIHRCSLGRGNFKLRAGERFFCQAVQRDQRQTASGYIPERQFIGFAAAKLNILRSPVKNITVHGPNLPDFDNRTGHQIADYDVSGSVRFINAVRVPDHFSAAVHDLKRDAGQRIAVCACHKAVDCQLYRGNVIERQLLRVAGLNPDSLRGVVQNISCNSANFLHVHCDAGSEVGNRNLPIGVADKFAVLRPNNRAAATFQKERNAGDGLCGSLFINLNGERLRGHVAKRQRLGVIGVDCDSLRFRAEDVSLRRFRFFHPVDAGVQIQKPDFSVFICPIDPACGGLALVLVCGFALRRGNFELRAGKFFSCQTVGLDNGKRTLRGVIKYHGLRPAALDLHSLGRGIQHKAGGGFCLPDCDAHAGGQVLQKNLTAAVCHKIAVGSPQRFSIRIGNMEGHTGNGRGAVGDILLHHKPLRGDIVEVQRLRFPGANPDRFGRGVQHIPVSGADFFCGNRRAGNQSRQKNLAMFIGLILAVGFA